MEIKTKRTVSVAGECYALPFMVKNNCVVDANNQKVAEVGTASSARWLAQVLNEHFYMDDEASRSLIKDYAKIIDNLREENKDLRERSNNQAQSIKNYYKELTRLALENLQLKNEIQQRTP